MIEGTETSASSAVPGSGDHDRYQQMFPTLTAAQVAEIASFGAERSYAPGAMLWNVGDRDTDFYVVLDGRLDVVRRDALAAESLVTSHTPGRFSGETGMLTGRGMTLAGRAGTGLRVLAVPVAKLRELVVTNARLGEIIMRSFILRRVRMVADRASDLLVVGSHHCAGTHRLLEFLIRNNYPHHFLDVESAADVSELLSRFDVGPSDLPIVITSRGMPLRNPSLAVVADHLGLSFRMDDQALYDLAVVGAGPAGLASAVYAASEGLSVIVADPMAPGGQAGTSSKIENYLGFPTGISGQALAGRAFMQAQKFGAKIAIPARITRMRCGNAYHELDLDTGDSIRSRFVVIASGARYGKLPLANLEEFEGVGVYYGATYLESQDCRGGEVAIVGGGNSAGQAAVYLAETAEKVYLIVRSSGLASTMSQYLIRRIESTANIELLPWTEVVELEGHTTLQAIRWRNRRTNDEVRRRLRHLFVFIGATPNTGFLPDTIATDAKGFICTGSEVTRPDREYHWPLDRPPYPLETSCPGVFAAGDVRSTSIKRVASAVGEGSVAVQFVHQLLASHPG